jgi:hypothetical protein
MSDRSKGALKKRFRVGKSGSVLRESGGNAPRTSHLALSLNRRVCLAIIWDACRQQIVYLTTTVIHARQDPATPATPDDDYGDDLNSPRDEQQRGRLLNRWWTLQGWKENR